MDMVTSHVVSRQVLKKKFLVFQSITIILYKWQARAAKRTTILMNYIKSCSMMYGDTDKKDSHGRLII